jgi:hypothetical protein
LVRMKFPILSKKLGLEEDEDERGGEIEENKK